MADARRYRDLADYCASTGRKKVFVAEQLGVSRYQMSGLLNPNRYAVAVDDELTAKIAALLNQPISHVRKLYSRAA